ncbi:MAG: DUF1702 family protein [Acidobacteriota bacterium]
MVNLGRLVFGMSEREVLYSQRGFEPDEAGVYRRLEGVGRAFLAGYHAALEESSTALLTDRLESMEPERRGFTYEGAAMGLTIRDALAPWRASRLHALLEGSGAAHAYLMYVGVGWAMARLPRVVHRAVPTLDPLLGWLVYDGWGFHQAYFAPDETVRRGERPRGLGPYAQRAFDQGVGRCLWFVEAARVDRVAASVAALGDDRANDLWAGVGLAAAFAGGVDDASLERLRAASGDQAPALAQGVAFAAKARLLPETPTVGLERAARSLCGMSSAAASAVTDDVLDELLIDARFESDATLPSYETWRRQIQAHFETATAAPLPHAPHDGTASEVPLQRNTA